MKYIHWTGGLATLTVITWFSFQVTPESTVEAQSGSRYQQRGGIQSGRSYQQRSMNQGGMMRAPATYEQKLWSWLKRVEYHNWAPGPGKSTEAYPGQSPHGAFLKTYLNRTAAGHPKTLPPGSIILKENFGPDGKTLMAVTVMYRAEGYNPEANDWYWVKYTPNGNVAMTPPEKGSMPIAGKFASCIECHAGAEGNDFAFIND